MEWRKMVSCLYLHHKLCGYVSFLFVKWDFGLARFKVLLLKECASNR